MRVLLLVLALTLGALTIRPAQADEVMHIAAIVNDDVISAYDVHERLKLALSATGQPDTPANEARLHDQILRQLIDGRLEMQEAKRLKITVSDQDIERAFGFLEKQNHMPAGTLPQYLKQRGIDRTALVNQLTTEIAWSRVVRKEFLPKIDISDADVQAALARIKAHMNENESQLSLILLTFDQPDQAAKVGRQAADLATQLRNGGNFAGVARQFSQGPGASTGGDVGWVEPGTLPEAVDKVIATLPLNTISDPIRTLGGFYIVEVRDRRRIANAPPPTPISASLPPSYHADPDATVRLTQIFLPFGPKTPPAEIQRLAAEARQAAAGAKSCQDMDRIAGTMAASGSGDLGTIKLSSLPAIFQMPAATLPLSQVSAPIMASNGVHVLMVCTRTGVSIAAAPPPPATAKPAGPAALPSTDEVRQRLVEQKIDLMARGLLRDLRRDATVELR